MAKRSLTCPACGNEFAYGGRKKTLPCPECGADVAVSTPRTATKRSAAAKKGTSAGKRSPQTSSKIKTKVITPTKKRASTSGRNDTKVESSAKGSLAGRFQGRRNFLSDYTLREIVGRGGFAVVYRALQKSLNRDVAVKIIKKNMMDRGSTQERFVREIEAMSDLNHPNIVTVYDCGFNDDEIYFSCELVEGMNLRELLKKGPVKEERAVEIVKHLCDALSYAHKRKIIHRDIKPENILIDKDGNVKITDFGIARRLDSRKAKRTVTLTMENSTIGTAYYMAPEQRKSGHEIDERADIYSVGVVLFELLTSDVPIGNLDYYFESNDRINKKYHLLIKDALNPAKSYRPRSINVFLSRLMEITPLGEKVYLYTAPKRKVPLSGLLAASIILLGVVITVFSLLTVRINDRLQTAQRKNRYYRDFLTVMGDYNNNRFDIARKRVTKLQRDLKTSGMADEQLALLVKRQAFMIDNRMRSLREEEDAKTAVTKRQQWVAKTARRQIKMARRYWKEFNDTQRALNIINAVVEKFPLNREAKDLQQQLYQAIQREKQDLQKRLAKIERSVRQKKALTPMEKLKGLQRSYLLVKQQLAKDANPKKSRQYHRRLYSNYHSVERLLRNPRLLPAEKRQALRLKQMITKTAERYNVTLKRAKKSSRPSKAASSSPKKEES